MSLRRVLKRCLQGLAVVLFGLVAVTILFRSPQPDATPDKAASSDPRYGATSALMDLARAEVATMYCHGVILEQAAVARLTLDHGLSLSDRDSDHGRLYAASLETFEASASPRVASWCAGSIDALAAPTSARPALLRRAG